MIYAMVGATKQHNRIVDNVFARLLAASRGGPCRVYVESVKLRAAEDSIYYPDVMVACEPEEDPLVEHKPCLIVEVASPSTGSIYRREEMLAYRKIPTLQAYLIASQDERRVERHWRGEWRQGEAVGEEGFIPVPRPETKLPLTEVYEGL